MYIIIRVETKSDIPDLEGEFETLEQALKYMNDKIVNNENENSYIKNISKSDIIDYYEKEDNYMWPNKSILKYKYRIIKLKNYYLHKNFNKQPEEKTFIEKQKKNNKKSYKDIVNKL